MHSDFFLEILGLKRVAVWNKVLSLKLLRVDILWQICRGLGGASESIG